MYKIKKISYHIYFFKLIMNRIRNKWRERETGKEKEKK